MSVALKRRFSYRVILSAPSASLELSPPLLTLHPGPYPTHACLGFRPKQHILAMSLRDPADDRDMPTNGNDFVSALCLRGVRKVELSLLNVTCSFGLAPLTILLFLRR